MATGDPYCHSCGCLAMCDCNATMSRTVEYFSVYENGPPSVVDAMCSTLPAKLSYLEETDPVPPVGWRPTSPRLPSYTENVDAHLPGIERALALNPRLHFVSYRDGVLTLAPDVAGIRPPARYARMVSKFGREDSMSRNELMAKLRELVGGECEESHAKADALLLEYIDDQEIAEAFDSIEKWYA